MNDEGEWINERSRKDSNGTSRAYSIPLWPIARGQAYRGMRHDREDIHTPMFERDECVSNSVLYINVHKVA
jgi:hypothetical protein